MPVLADMIIDFESFFNNGQAKVCINKKCGVINNRGEWIIKPKYDSINQGDGDIKIYSEYYIVAIKEKYGVIDKQENIILSPEYDYLRQSNLGEGFFIAKLNDKWGIIDINNNIICDFKYDGLDCIHGKNNYFSAYIKSKDK